MRRQILEAAEWCFVQKGFQGASIADISARAKMSAGHLYHYFSSKEAMVGAMIEARLEHAATRFEQITASANPVEALIAEIGRGESLKQSGAQYLLLDILASARRNPAMAEILREQGSKVHRFLAGLLRAAQGRGQIDPGLDADICASILMSMMDGMKTLTIRDPKLDMAKAIDLLKILIARFLAMPPRSEAPN